MDHYEYEQLPGPDSIRILTIRPNQYYESPLECTLEHAALDSSSDYRALSYCWGMNDNGDASLCRSIQIQKKSLPISRNLFEGLKRIRSTTQRIRIWIDAVCINQADVDERNAQVSRMASIYSLAKSVVVWLGEGASPEADREAYDVLQHFHANNCENTNTGFFLRQKIRRVRRTDRWVVVAPCAMLGPCAVASALQSGNVLLQSLTQASRWEAIPEPIAAGNVQRAKRKACMCLVPGCSMCEAKVTAESFVGIRTAANDCIMVPCDEKTYVDLQRVCGLFIPLLSRRYFSRRWIVQELRLAASVEATSVLWGSYNIALPKWQDSIENFRSFIWRQLHALKNYDKQRLLLNNQPSLVQDVITEAYHAVSSVDVVLTRKVEWSYGQNTHATPVSSPGNVRIMQILALYDHLECSDDRDRLYALAGLDPNFQLPDSYSLTFEQTCVWFAQWLVRRGRFVDIVLSLSYQYAQNTSAQWRSSELPSWVPDLRLRCASQLQHVQVKVAVTSNFEIRAEMHYAGLLVDVTYVDPEDEQNELVIFSVLDTDGIVHKFHHMPNGLHNVRVNDLVCILPPFSRFFVPDSLMLCLRPAPSAADKFEIIHVSYHTIPPELCTSISVTIV